MNAIYPLVTHPTTFDFAAWIVIAKTHGCDHVRFVVDGPIAQNKYPDYLAWRRFGNIVVPLCLLAKMPFSVGSEIDGHEFPYFYGKVEAAYRTFGSIAKLEAPAPLDRHGYITVTMRDSFRNEFRNSNRDAWDRFVKVMTERGRKVVVLEECENAPLALEYRMALYANADMNLGASNGPMALCHFSDAPYITLNMAPKRPAGDTGYDPGDLNAAHGFPIGSQFSFRNSRQALVWKPDTFENIMEAFAAVSDERIAA